MLRRRQVPIKWEKFSDSGMDHIVVGGFYDDEGKPKNIIRRSHILFLADFFSNDAILSQCVAGRASVGTPARQHLARPTAVAFRFRFALSPVSTAGPCLR